jgi:regulator of telomere elongation helicase 1
LTKKCQITRKNKKKKCEYFKENNKNCAEVDWSPRDIEDLNKLGEQHKFCPYYMSSERIEDADIVFMPYNYILDCEILMKYDINITNSILIFDEAHNLAQAAE